MAAELMGDWSRSHLCGALRPSDAASEATLMGWVHKTRDHGGVVFIDLRDHTGITQVVFHPQHVDEAVLVQARALRSESVIGVRGTVTARPESMVNKDLPTGGVELDVHTLRVLNLSLTPPFAVDDEAEVSEDLRLKYRFIDLRRPSLQEAMRLRSKASLVARQYLCGEDFIEIETPMLVRPTPEGARDYIVPARLHPGRFYALPQSPQLYKQILMVSGMNRYFQLARCMRDEDLRADRQPEHTQIDLEMAFVREDDVFAVIEGLMAAMWKACIGVELKTPFQRMTYNDAMNRFGSDKPDLRFDLELVDVSEAVRASAFKVFADTVAKGGAVKALRVPGGAEKSRKDIETLEATAKTYGAKGLAWTKIKEGAFEGGIGKFLDGDTTLRDLLGGESGDLLLFVADTWNVACKALGAVRTVLGEPLIAGREKEFRFLWVREFPLFDYNADQGRWEPAHHIFSMPRPEDIPFLESDPGRVHANLYDLVANGLELGSGSIRIHRRDIQERVMRVIGVTDEEAEQKFGFLLDSFQYGAPPHGGIATGLDRLIMLMTGRRSLRDVIAFPKTARASSLMDGAPAEVDPQDLQDLRIRVVT